MMTTDHQTTEFWYLADDKGFGWNGFTTAKCLFYPVADFMKDVRRFPTEREANIANISFTMERMTGGTLERKTEYPTQLGARRVVQEIKTTTAVVQVPDLTDEAVYLWKIKKVTALLERAVRWMRQRDDKADWKYAIKMPSYYFDDDDEKELETMTDQLDIVALCVSPFVFVQSRAAMAAMRLSFEDIEAIFDLERDGEVFYKKGAS